MDREGKRWAKPAERLVLDGADEVDAFVAVGRSDEKRGDLRLDAQVQDLLGAGPHRPAGAGHRGRLVRGVEAARSGGLQFADERGNLLGDEAELGLPLPHWSGIVATRSRNKQCPPWTPEA